MGYLGKLGYEVETLRSQQLLQYIFYIVELYILSTENQACNVNSSQACNMFTSHAQKC